MGEKLIKPYEISVWEEQLTQIEGSNPAEYKFKEQKLAVIGSDTMTGYNRVYDPVFTKKVNGEKTLTFSLKYKYFDPYSGNEGIINPFAALLINERKVKLHYEDQWYEFIIKDHSESSDELTWTYTCTDAFVLELSKNGYNIEFNSELNNNLGTARELAEKTLENTDWQVGNSGDVFKQYVEEPIYNAKLVDISGIEIINTDNDSAASELQANTDIYLFYSYVKNKNGKFVQFIIKDDNEQYTIDDKNVITATNYRIIDELVYQVYYDEVNNPESNPKRQQWYELDGSEYVLTEDEEVDNTKQYYQINRGFWLQEEGQPDRQIILLSEIEKVFQANRLNYTQKTTYDPVMGKTVDIYEVGDREVYRYTEDLYTTSNVVQNFIANGDNFNALEDGTLQGWNPYVDSQDNESIQKMELITYPELEYGKKLVDIDKLSTIDGYLKVRFIGALTGDYLNAIYNDGFESNLSSIGPIARGDEFLFRWRAGRGELGNLQPVQSLGLLIAKCERDTPLRWGRYYYHIDTNDIVLNVSGTPKTLNSIIEGGKVSEDFKTYIIDNVTQTPSTKYLYRSDDSYYYWDGIEGIFTLHSTIVNGEEVVEPTSTFLPYYYLSGKATKALTQTVLDDPTITYGIFIYTTDNNIAQEAQIDESFEEEYRTLEDETTELITPLPTEMVEDIEAKLGTPIRVTYTNKNSITKNYTFAAGTSNLEDANCKYDATKYTIAFDDNIGITNYHIEYFEIAPIYFRDMQFTRCIYDANKKPVILGNVPNATVSTVEHYYFKPSEGAAAEDIETYSSIEELEEITHEEVVPLYNEDCEKNLSISVSQSNCFNILQTIAETFECWVDLVVEHDPNTGYIIETNGKPNKYVYLREYAGKDNYTGFKYGINLNSIERTVNSDEIVTKLIVDQSQSEYVDEGYVSISNAPSNPSGEEYILNFDYYYNQGLLDRETAEDDKKQFIETVSQFNTTLHDLEEQRRNLEAAITSLGSKRNVFTELIDSAQDAQTEAIEDFQYLTKRSYEEYKDWYNQFIEEGETSPEEPEPEPSEDDESEEETDEADTLFEEENVLSVLGKLYTSSATINNYTGILDNVNLEYWDKRKTLKGSENHIVKIWTADDDILQTHLFVELDDYWQGVSFSMQLDDNETYTYEFTISNRHFDIPINNGSTEWELTFDVPDGYTIEQETCLVHKGDTIQNKILAGEEVTGVEKQIDEVLEQKKEYVKNFNNKYSRFIVEGTWNSTDYIDSELYYLDALQVSNTSAQPAVSYTINVVEVSQLEGLSDYLFDAGDKTYVEDTEFFGWSNINIGTKESPIYVQTPAREEVIVAEVEWHLEEPENNVITVQNYKTRFEDLFQRISAAVQTVQYNEATYAKISSLMDANGTINSDVLVQSLQQIAGQQYNLTSDGSVLIDEDRILVRNLHNAQNLVIINSEGIRISADGGRTWRTAIDGQGINIGTVYTGKLNTNNVIIGSEDSPSFRWDKSGISAYKSDGTTLDKEGHEIPAYDLQTYVRYDEYGLYGIKNNGLFKAQSLEDIKNNAHFAVTWDGFFIKNSYPGGGRVEITSENDFRILKKDSNDEEKEVIKIGALEWDGSPIRPVDSSIPPSLYGIRITNDDGIDTFKTGTDGNIEITGIINAMGGNFNTVINVGPTDQNHIIIDGTDGPNSPSISSSNYNDGASTGWIINKDGDAVFNNITARGAIKTAVFEYAEIQAVGGIFIFRPSSVIKSARISNNDSDLIVTVEKPLLFKKISYNQIFNPASGSNPKTLGWYEKPAYGGYKLTDDIVVNSEKEYYVRVETANGSWCKISNYISDGTIADATIHNILNTNGLTHVYEVSDINSDGEITLAGAKAFVTAVKQVGQSDQDVLNALVGGALIDMGRTDGSSNYGIGINSSDNTVNLPARAISLFETTINANSTNNLKVGYDIRGILGTLPILEYTGDKPKVNEIYHNNLEGTQGIYTDNMYIGNHDQYITFYSSKEDGSKHLKINAQEFTLKAGAFNRRAVDGRQNFVYLSNEDYAKDIVNGIQINNSNVKADWRLIIGNKFGVDKAGNLYAANAHIEGDIQATSGHFGSISYDGNTTTIPENAITGLTEKLNQISNEASLKGYTLHVESIYPDYPSEIIDGTPDNITLIAHVYYANRDITTSCDPNLFIWQLKNEEQIETLTPNIDNPYSVTYDRNLAGYGTTIICNFAIDEEVLLTTPDHFALETPDGYLLTARV